MRSALILRANAHSAPTRSARIKKCRLHPEDESGGSGRWRESRCLTPGLLDYRKTHEGAIVFQTACVFPNGNRRSCLPRTVLVFYSLSLRNFPMAKHRSLSVTTISMVLLGAVSWVSTGVYANATTPDAQHPTVNSEASTACHPVTPKLTVHSSREIHSLHLGKTARPEADCFQCHVETELSSQNVFALPQKSACSGCHTDALERPGLSKEKLKSPPAKVCPTIRPSVTTPAPRATMPRRFAKRTAESPTRPTPKKRSCGWLCKIPVFSKKTDGIGRKCPSRFSIGTVSP